MRVHPESTRMKVDPVIAQAAFESEGADLHAIAEEADAPSSTSLAPAFTPRFISRL